MHLSISGQIDLTRRFSGGTSYNEGVFTTRSPAREMIRMLVQEDPLTSFSLKNVA